MKTLTILNRVQVTSDTLAVFMSSGNVIIEQFNQISGTKETTILSKLELTTILKLLKAYN